jgi:signal transduction histidine kinase/CheY-like chemotaxis protein
MAHASDGVRILLVDDTPGNLVVLQSVLARPDYELVPAPSGADALRYLLTNDCALILMDVQMPGLDGYETASLIRQNERTRNIPIVFVTAFGTDERHVRRGYASGAIDYVFKPYDAEVLRSKVEAFVTLHRAQQQLLAQSERLRDAQRREHAHALAQLELRSLRRQEAAQRRYRALVDGVTHAVVWVADAVSHALRFASPSSATILGTPAEEWVADLRPLPERVYPDDRPAFVEALRALEPGGAAIRVQHRMTRPRAPPVWLETALRLLPTEDGDALEVHGFSVDVTETMRARDALRFLARVGEELARSLECAETATAVARLAVPHLADWCAVEVFPDDRGGERIVAAAHSDPTLEDAARALAAHPAFARLGPCEELRVIESLATELLRVPDPECAALVARLEAGSALEVPLSVRGRPLGVIRLFSGPERLPPGSRERALAEELGRRAAQAIENAVLYLQAREAIRVREDFLSIASHELRTPLSALSLQMRLLDGMVSSGKLPLASELGPELRRRVGTGIRQVDRLTKLVNSLLDLARIRSGKLELEVERFDLRELVRDVAARFEDALAKAGRELLVEAGTPAIGRWDRSRLDQLVTNLVSNAVKYGGAGPIEVSVVARGVSAVLSVRDRGPGIAPADLEVIFERFMQGSGAAANGGLGLGLFISRKIAEAHGGAIRAESAPGEGTTFHLELPCEELPLAASEPPALAM